MTSEDLLEMVGVAVKAARTWEAKANANWAARTYTQAVLAALRAAVKEPSVESGEAVLLRVDVPMLLERAVSFTGVLAKEIEGRKVPASVVGGNYHLSVLAHVGWLVGEPGLASSALDIANAIEIRELSPDFWVEYADALGRLNKGGVYDAPNREWKREQYWAPYLGLISDLSHRRDEGDQVSVIEAVFRKRNADRRFLSDQYGIEGSGREPAEWDFRLVSLLAFAARNPNR